MGTASNQAIRYANYTQSLDFTHNSFAGSTEVTHMCYRNFENKPQRCPMFITLLILHRAVFCTFYCQHNFNIFCGLASKLAKALFGIIISNH
jgi:hypothetical protein